MTEDSYDYPAREEQEFCMKLQWIARVLEFEIGIVSDAPPFYDAVEVTGHDYRAAWSFAEHVEAFATHQGFPILSRQPRRKSKPPVLRKYVRTNIKLNI